MHAGSGSGSVWVLASSLVATPPGRGTAATTAAGSSASASCWQRLPGGGRRPDRGVERLKGTGDGNIVTSDNIVGAFSGDSGVRAVKGAVEPGRCQERVCRGDEVGDFERGVERVQVGVDGGEG
jgi:hypothetical protein